MSKALFDSEYKKLNLLQKKAVETTEGPVMVVAGPGTGKTQILALRIGKILNQSDIKADSVLCLTFTNSAVRAMRERLRKYIGPEASKVKVATFHSFGLEMLEKYYTVLGLDREPKLMDEKDTIVLCDEILHSKDWEYIRPRSDAARHFRDLKSLISILKREGITGEEFRNELEKEIKYLNDAPESISSRGESKGELKKDVIKKIEGLERTKEAVAFYELYEETKKDRNLFDYDDILEGLNNIVSESDEARSAVKEDYLYVLIDEHQDSSGMQNKFLETVWKGEDQPNIFVVGDDRQLIYGFGGASLEYFENFKHTFGKAKLITLVDNYRSTQKILDSAHALMESSLTKDKLKSNHKENHNLNLVEAYYPRDEIIYLGLEIKKKIKEGHDVNDMAILVPKNKHVRSAVTVLRDMGVPVSGGDSMDLFDNADAESLIQVLHIITNPADGTAFANSFFNKNSGIPPIKAHEFIKDNKMREPARPNGRSGGFSLLNVEAPKGDLFATTNEVGVWVDKLKSWLALSGESVYSLVQKVGSEFLLNDAKNHSELTGRVEVVRTMLHLALMQEEKNPKLTLSDFLEFIARLESYGEKVPLAIFAPNEGVKVLTLHGSKGLEFDYVFIAHMDERSFTGTRAGGFTLTESIKNRIEKKDDEVSKRELYVAITRAKRFCTVSYALKSYSGGEQELSHIVADIADNFDRQSAEETEKIILKSDMKALVENKREEERSTTLEELTKLVARDYEDRKVSVSLLNNFFECTWKWYFRNLLQLPEAKSESLEFGNAVHSGIEQILKYKKEIKIEDKKVERVVSKWYKDRFKEISKQYQSEQSVSVNDDDFPHLNIYGKIDLVENLDGENVRVTDFKTGGVRKKNDIEKIDEEGRMSGYMRQLAMYSYLLKKSRKEKVDVAESVLEFVEAKDKKEAFYRTYITAEQIEMLTKDIADYDTLIKNGLWTTRPCNYNSYGKNTECEYCKRAEIYR